MKAEDIKSNEDLLNYIEGCVNDFEMGITDRKELMNNILELSIHTANTAIKFNGAIQLVVEQGSDKLTVNCPDEDDEIYVHVKRGSNRAGLSLSLDEAGHVANYILGHVKNARIS